MKNEYIAALVYYVYKKAKTDRGTAVVVRTAEICGVDRQCGWAMRVAMMTLVEAGVAVRHKPGVYMVNFLLSLNKSSVAAMSPGVVGIPLSLITA